MYEKYGLSSLERLVGRDVSSICFVRDYVEVHFDGLVLTGCSMPTVAMDDEKFQVDSIGYRDTLCTLIGKTVESVVERNDRDLSIYFGQDICLSISLFPESAISPTAAEAALLYDRDLGMIAVRQYK